MNGPATVNPANTTVTPVAPLPPAPAAPTLSTAEKATTPTTPRIKYEGKSTDDEATAIKNAQTFKDQLTTSLTTEIANWHGDAARKDANLALPLEIADRGEYSLDNYCLQYRECLERAIENNDLSPEDAKKVSINAADDAQRGALKQSEELYNNAKTVRDTLYDRTIKISKDRRKHGETIAYFGLLDGSGGDIKTELKTLTEKLADPDLQAVAKNDTSLGMLNNLLSEALNSDKLAPEQQADFIKKTSKNFAFLATEAKSKTRDVENINKAIESLAQDPDIKANDTLSALIQSSQKTFAKSLGDETDKMKKEVETAEAEVQKATTKKDTPAPKDPEDKSTAGIDPKTLEKVQMVKAAAGGAVGLTAVVVCSMFFPPIGVIAIAGAIAWLMNRNKGKAGEKEKPAETVVPETETESDERVAQAKATLKERRDAREAAAQAGEIKSATATAQAEIAQGAQEAQDKLLNAQGNLHQAGEIAAQGVAQASPVVETAQAAVAPNINSVTQPVVETPAPASVLEDTETNTQPTYDLATPNAVPEGAYDLASTPVVAQSPEIYDNVGKDDPEEEKLGIVVVQPGHIYDLVEEPKKESPAKPTEGSWTQWAEENSKDKTKKSINGSSIA